MDQNQMVEALGMLIKDNPFQRVSLGDTNINWVSTDGDPSSVAGATIAGDAYWNNQDNGVVLTENSGGQTGYLYWQKAYDLNNHMIINAVTRAGDGSGADGMTIFYGCADTVSIDQDQGGIAIYMDEWNDDLIKIYKAGVLLGEFNSYKTLDDTTYNNWTIVHEHVGTDQIILHVILNGSYIARLNIAPWVKAGDYIGISGVTIGSDNYHWAKSFQVKNGSVWVAANKY